MKEATFSKQYHDFVSESSYIHCPERCAIRLWGEDIKSWLQGQITQDIERLKSGNPIDFCFCKPTGQLEAICRCFLLRESYFMITDTISLPAIKHRIKNFVITEDVQAEFLDCCIYVLFGFEDSNKLEKILPNFKSVEGIIEDIEGKSCVLPSKRAGKASYECIVPKAQASIFESKLVHVPVLDQSFWETVTLLAGEPMFGVDTDSKTLPPELGTAFEKQYLNYSKGCYTGQEVLMRIHSRGHTNRVWMGLCSEMPIKAGSFLTQPEKQEAGYITRSSWFPSLGYFAGAYVRKEVAKAGEKIYIKQDKSEIKAVLCEMPFKTV